MLDWVTNNYIVVSLPIELMASVQNVTFYYVHILFVFTSTWVLDRIRPWSTFCPKAQLITKLYHHRHHLRRTTSAAGHRRPQKTLPDVLILVGRPDFLIKIKYLARDRLAEYNSTMCAEHGQNAQENKDWPEAKVKIVLTRLKMLYCK